MKEKPIIFSTEMVGAILAGRKTQTRRVMKPQPKGESRPLSEWSAGIAAACHDHSPNPDKLTAHQKRLKGIIFPFLEPDCGLVSWPCPYGKPSDRLWVREKFSFGGNGYFYGTDMDGSIKVAWSSPIHMPRKASRLTLEITNVRVERLRDITDKDAKAEGVIPCPACGTIRPYRHTFENGWDKLNAKRGFCWSENPWVWVIEFKITGQEKIANLT